MDLWKVKDNFNDFFATIFRPFFIPMILTIVGVGILMLILKYEAIPDIYLNKTELILLFIVLVTEFVMLRRMHLERIERISLQASLLETTRSLLSTSNHLQETQRSLIETRRELGRENYLSLIRESIEEAKNEVLFTTRSMTAPEKEPQMAGIITASAEKKKQNSDFVHRGIIAPRHDTLAGAYRLIEAANIDIRFHDYYNSSTLRFVVIDGKKSIIGIAKPDEPTERSYLFESYTLARVLIAEFDRLWSDGTAIKFDKYLEVTLSSLEKLPAIEKQRRLNIPMNIIEAHGQPVRGVENY